MDDAEEWLNLCYGRPVQAGDDENCTKKINTENFNLVPNERNHSNKGNTWKACRYGLKVQELYCENHM